MQKSLAAGCQLDVVSFSSTLSACEKAWRWRPALQSLQTTQDRQIPVDRTLLNSTISAFEKGSQWLQAVVLALSMRHFDCEANVVSFNAACSACEKAAYWSSALELYDWAKDFGLEADAVSGNSLLKATPRWPQALVLLQNLHLKSIFLDDLALRLTLEKLQREPLQLVKLLERSSDSSIRRFRSSFPSISIDFH